jgi:hypothetical protein
VPIFQLKPVLIVCDDVAKPGLLNGVQYSKKLMAFCDPPLPLVVYQLV